MLPSAEHLLLAQQQAQPQTHAHSRHLKTNSKYSLALMSNRHWFPLCNLMVSLCDLWPWRSLRELWCLLQEMAAPCEVCSLVPRAVLAARHEIQACCWHRFVPHICYVAAKIALLSHAFLLLTWNHRIRDSFMLGKTFEMIKSSC